MLQKAGKPEIQDGRNYIKRKKKKKKMSGANLSASYGSYNKGSGYSNRHVTDMRIEIN